MKYRITYRGKSYEIEASNAGMAALAGVALFTTTYRRPWMDEIKVKPIGENHETR